MVYNIFTDDSEKDIVKFITYYNIIIYDNIPVRKTFISGLIVAPCGRPDPSDIFAALFRMLSK